MGVDCFICQKIFSSQSNVNKHLRNFHKQNLKNIVTYEGNVFKNKCSIDGCFTSFRYISDLRHHLEDEHKKILEKEVLEFSNIEDFKSWLKNVHVTQGVQYVCYPAKSKGVYYYYCSRSAKYNKKNKKSRISSLRNKGSNKLNTACTSQIILCERNGKYSATYHKTHLHEIDLKHIRISDEEKKNVAAKLESGLTSKEIMNDIRDNSNNTDLKRIDLITPKDIRNIKIALQNENLNTDKVQEKSPSIEFCVVEQTSKKNSLVIELCVEEQKIKEEPLSIKICDEEETINKNNCVLLYECLGDHSYTLPNNDCKSATTKQAEILYLQHNSLEPNDNIQELKTQIKNTLDLIQNKTDEFVNNCDYESLSKIYSSLYKVESEVSSICKNQCSDSSNVVQVAKDILPTNKSIQNENTVNSTNKKRKLSKPSMMVEDKEDLKQFCSSIFKRYNLCT